MIMMFENEHGERCVIEGKRSLTGECWRKWQNDKTVSVRPQWEWKW